MTMAGAGRAGAQSVTDMVRVFIAFLGSFSLKWIFRIALGKIEFLPVFNR